MNAFSIIVIVFCLFYLAYRIYGRTLDTLWNVDEKRPTPALTQTDTVDYIPAKNALVLFGHHFSSIAGAGPIVGPIMACLIWGWAPTLAWVVVGSIFLGSIHDYGALMISVREKGSSIGDIAATAISRKAKLIFSIFLWLTLILIVAVFTYLAADTFSQQAQIVIPSFGLIPVAVCVGIALYRFKGPLVPVTFLGLCALAGLIFLGNIFPISIATNGRNIWIFLLLAYSFFASVLPVNYLLQPRDYLSSFLLFAGIILGLTGILLTQPVTQTPAFISTGSAQGSLWPMMFITVACGAISGFHSLISSGTTSKQIISERDAKKIGFGGMLTEGFLATLVILVFASSFSLPEFYLHRSANTNPITLFGQGFGQITKSFLGPWGNFLALFILNAFILTTLDSATRIARYITEEISFIKNRFFSTFIVIVCAGALAMAKDTAHLPLWKKIWPLFGASNQLVAALALIVITCWILQKRKTGLLYALLPAAFMLITALTALAIKVPSQWRNQEFLLVIISIILIIAALLLLVEVLTLFKHRRRND